MSDPGANLEARARVRPRGFLQPTHEGAARALKALKEKRPADAARHIAALPDSTPIECAWKSLLIGLSAIEDLDFATAETTLREAAEVASKEKTSSEPSEQAVRARLSATALEKIGWLLRRKDHAQQAHTVHLEAYRLREAWGSAEELWETAISLGQDARIARRSEEAQTWFEKAVVHAGVAKLLECRLQAVAYAQLAVVLTDQGQHEKAVSAARSSLAQWRQHDPGGVDTARALMELSHASLKRGEALVECGDPCASAVLEELLKGLHAAHEELSAFGPSCFAEVQTCLALQDFARRLLAVTES
ncbi:MAG: hypothetical protein IIC01_06440 [Planctomycetes bacterium]|nr:hypothetical protein [Planctomycetota bacterium]